MEHLEDDFDLDPGGGWNYRIVEVDGVLHLREIYYRSDGSIRMWTQEPAAPIGDDREDLAGAILQMTNAFDRPILRLVDNRFVEVDDEPSERRLVREDV